MTLTGGGVGEAAMKILPPSRMLPGQASRSKPEQEPTTLSLPKVPVEKYTP